MLRFKEVHKSFKQGARRVEALRGVNIQIDEPGFFAVMGPSGSGKSTVLHLAAGLDKADQGTVWVGGHNLGEMSERELTVFRRLQVGVVFQQFNLVPTLSATQNIALPAVIDGRTRRWMDHRLGQLLDLFDLRDRADHRPESLSGGEQQRVAIARALLFEPALFLADEPTGNLDSHASQGIWLLLGELARQRQIAVVMVTHEPAAAAHCKRVFALKDGRIIDSFDVGDLDASGVASRYQQLDW